MKHSNTKKAEAKVVVNKKANGTIKKVVAKPQSKNINSDQLNVREIDWQKTTRDISMIERELICKQLRYELNFNHKGKEWTIASMWQPGSGAALIQIAAEKATIDGLKDYDLAGIVKAVARDRAVVDFLVKNTSTPPAKRIKQIVRQWVRHTTALKDLPKSLVAKASSK